jgi:hypothetical protein
MQRSRALSLYIAGVSQPSLHMRQRKQVMNGFIARRWRDIIITGSVELGDFKNSLFNIAFQRTIRSIDKFKWINEAIRWYSRCFSLMQWVDVTMKFKQHVRLRITTWQKPPECVLVLLTPKKGSPNRGTVAKLLQRTLLGMSELVFISSPDTKEEKMEKIIWNAVCHCSCVSEVLAFNRLSRPVTWPNGGAARRRKFWGNTPCRTNHPTLEPPVSK